MLDKRTELVAQKITEFLKGTDRFDKTIVFCEDIDHAERMRQALVNANADLATENPRYVNAYYGRQCRGQSRTRQLHRPRGPLPSHCDHLEAHVDGRGCPDLQNLIVLDQRIQSMTEFKQIIGRGTRINEEYGKLHFTIMDFKKATELFADPDFDGDPVQVYNPSPDEDPVPPEDDEGDLPDDGDGQDEDGDDVPPLPPDIIIDDWPTPPKRKKFYVDDVPVWTVAERVQYYGKDGKLITESLKDYTRRTVLEEFSSLDEFLQNWNEAEKKEAIIDELEDHGVLLEALADEVGKEFDAFDLICHVAYDRPPLTRKERAENVRKQDYFAKFGDQARAVLEALLDKYATQGIAAIEKMGVLKVQPFDEFGTPIEIINLFGGREEYRETLRDLEKALYEAA